MQQLGNIDNGKFKGWVEPSEINYFTVSTKKFIFMYFCTFSLYSIYWHYKNWALLKSSKTLKIMPFWRAFFSPLWAFSLFNFIYESAGKYNIKTKKSPIILAALYFIVSAFSTLPEPYWLISLFAFSPLLAVNSLAVKINKSNKSFVENKVIKIWLWPIFILQISFICLILYSSLAGDGIKEFIFRKTIENRLAAKCNVDASCISAVRFQTRECMVKAGWVKYDKNTKEKTEFKRFTSEFYACIVNDNGDPYFKSE